MQMITPLLLDAEAYVAEQAHRLVKRPSHCPQCSRQKSLRALGFYSRCVTACDSGKIVSIKVRRFLCQSCRKTISILPAFAQPYRLVCNATVERAFNGGHAGRDLLRWHGLLRRYWRRFNAWIPDLLLIVGRAVGLSPPQKIGEGSWRAVMEAYGHLDQATRKLVKQFRVTLFGRYQCHTPASPDG